MRTSIIVYVSLTALVGFGVGWSAGCAAGAGSDATSTSGGAIKTGPGASSSACVACLSDSDCSGGGVCAQFQGDMFCAAPCGGGRACPTETTCTPETTSNGLESSVCVPDEGSCGPVSSVAPDAKGCDAGLPASCDKYATPGTKASCRSCKSSSPSCQANGCYGGWWCDTATVSCVSPPKTCTGTASCADAGKPNDSGSEDSGKLPGDSGGDSGPVTGVLGGSGGTLSSLKFAVVGDTRPANEDDTAGYPTKIIETIFKDLEGASIPFSVSTGDYQYANPSGTQSKAQLDLYMAARGMYSGWTYPAMGNHECTGYTDSNCGPGSSSGDTSNYSNFLSIMLAPDGQTLPYYSINIDATDGSWTSKFVFIAANAWNSAQSAWLTKTMAVSTTYTFVLRHEATEADTAPGVKPSDAIIAKYPYTLEINGHTHTYEWSSTNKVIVGNGGAPVTGGVDYGYGLIEQQSNGDITVDMVDYLSGAKDSSFHREFTPTGAEVK